MSDVETLEAAIGEAKPGSVIAQADGTYRTMSAIEVTNKTGLGDRPIVIRAAHRGKAILGGQQGSP